MAGHEEPRGEPPENPDAGAPDLLF